MERVSAARSRGLGRMRLCRLEKDVALLAERKLDHAFRREIAMPENHLLVGNGGIVDAETAALDLAARLAIRRDEAGFDEQRQHAGAGVEFGTRDFNRRKV